MKLPFLASPFLVLSIAILLLVPIAACAESEETRILPPTGAISDPHPVDQVAWLLEHKEQWPHEVITKERLEFPLVVDGKIMGSVSRPAGSSLQVSDLSTNQITVSFNSFTTNLPIDLTNLREIAARTLMRQMQQATATPRRTPSPSPSLKPTPSPRQLSVGANSIIKTIFKFGIGNIPALKNASLFEEGHRFGARIEGQGASPESYSIVSDPTSTTGRVLHYLCTSQHDGHKARVEHYIYVSQMDTPFITEFSIKLDKEFTPVGTIRPDGGVEWCCLHQWHQTLVSPPLALTVKNGTKDVLFWSMIYRETLNGKYKHIDFPEQKIQLDHWYHFRVKWRISPDQNGYLMVMMSDSILPKDLDDRNAIINYHGPIGYAFNKDNAAKPDATGELPHGEGTIREHIGFYQGPHPDPTTHHGMSVDNVAIYELGK